MEFKPHDTLAKTVIMQLGVGRELIPESELRIASYGDVVLRPGPAFPPFTGMLGELVGTGLVLMEFYASRPSVDALLGVRAKGFMALNAERSRQRGLRGELPTPSNIRIIIVSMGQALHPRQQAWEGGTWVHQQPGYSWLEGPPLVLFLDLFRLPLTSSTCWLHLAGDGPYPQQTLDFVWRQGPEAERIMGAIAEELPIWS